MFKKICYTIMLLQCVGTMHTADRALEAASNGVSSLAQNSFECLKAAAKTSEVRAVVLAGAVASLPYFFGSKKVTEQEATVSREDLAKLQSKVKTLEESLAGTSVSVLAKKLDALTSQNEQLEQSLAGFSDSHRRQQESINGLQTKVGALLLMEERLRATEVQIEDWREHDEQAAAAATAQLGAPLSPTPAPSSSEGAYGSEDEADLGDEADLEDEADLGDEAE
jgi:DNA repair exonuclease SbcCD ATPase subunit